MTANHARLLFNERLYGLPAKWLLLALGVLLLALEPSRPRSWVVVAYAAVTVLATGFFGSRWGKELAAAGAIRGAALPYWLSQLADALYVTALIAWGGGLASPLYLLYALLALKSLVYTPDLRWIVWLPFLFGLLYALALLVAHGSLAFLADSLFLARYLLTLALIIGVTLATWALASRLRQVDRLQVVLNARNQDLATQTRALQRTATDLGQRVLELRSLQEAAKALSATPYMDETLRAIVERLRGLAGSPHCAVALLDGERGAVTHLVTAAAQPAESSLLSLPLSLAENGPLGEILQAGRSQALAPLADLPALTGLARAWRAEALEVTPMMARGQPVGALLVGLESAEGSGRWQRSLAESFAYFAATAVENARLYGDVAEKGRELQAVLAGIGDGVLVADTEGALVLMNPVTAHIFRLESPPPGTPLRSLALLGELTDLLNETASAGQVLIRELPIPSAGTASDGEPRTFQALAAPVYRSTQAGDQVSGVVTILRDITAHKELERMKSNFLSVVSHELRTPLHSIKGFVDIILMGKTGPVTELQRDFLSTVKEQTGHLQRLIEDLLEFSRLESGQVRLRPVHLAPASLAASVIEKLSPLAADKQIDLHMALPPDFPEIEADATRLEQVLTNLIENAIKFTPADKRIQLLGWDRGGAVEMAVIDEGIGVPLEERERVFERFYQSDSGARRRYKGAGLGLTICKHIVTQHGGRIWIEGDPDGGSEFHFTLPKQLHRAEEGEAALDFGALTGRDGAT